MGTRGDKQDQPITRRKALVSMATGALVGGGALAATWPFLAQMAPNPSSPRPDELQVDLSAVKDGQTLAVRWHQQPVFIRRRSADEIALATQARLDDLKDTLARNANLPANALATDANRALAGHPEWLIVVGVCTYLGCTLKSASAAMIDEPGVAYVCPCHGSRYDLAGRILHGPAPRNLDIPPVRLIHPARLQIGA